jgi:hypothetical protein
MTAKEIREFRIKTLKTNWARFIARDYRSGGPLIEVKKILGVKSTYLKDIEDISDEDLETVWEHTTSYSKTRDEILAMIDERANKASKEGHSLKAAELYRLARTIEDAT